jgi:hypothetical protein
VAGVVDEALAVLAVAVGAVEDRQVLVGQVRRALDRLGAADDLVGLVDLLAGEPDRPQQVEAERGSTLSSVNPSAAARLAERRTTLKAWRSSNTPGRVFSIFASISSPVNPLPAATRG